MTETEYTPHLLAALNRAGRQTRLWRQNAGKAPKRDRRGKIVGAIHGAPAGAADLTGFVSPEGWRLEVELKAHHTRVTPEQDQWERLLTYAGCIYVRCRYDNRLTLADNIAKHVTAVDAAIAARRNR